MKKTYHFREFAEGEIAHWLRSDMSEIDVIVVGFTPKKMWVKCRQTGSRHCVDPMNVIGGTFVGLH